MLLYHGTTAVHLERILKHGLRTRKQTRKKSNFKECPSHEDCIYLSDCYAPYFAANVAKMRQHWLIVEVEVNPLMLLPDEDYLEQASRSESTTGGLRRRTALYRQHLFEYSHLALASLKHLGTAAIASTNANMMRITRTAIFDCASNMYVASMCIDPQISMLNHMILGTHYQTLTRWFFDPTVTAEDLCKGTWSIYDDAHRNVMNKAVQNRTGLEIRVHDGGRETQDNQSV